MLLRLHRCEIRPATSGLDRSRPIGAGFPPTRCCPLVSSSDIWPLQRRLPSTIFPSCSLPLRPRTHLVGWFVPTPLPARSDAKHVAQHVLLLA
eukprot:scaffold412_cov311-Pavlova_lutheri.AAC.14